MAPSRARTPIGVPEIHQAFYEWKNLQVPDQRPVGAGGDRVTVKSGTYSLERQKKLSKWMVTCKAGTTPESGARGLLSLRRLAVRRGAA